MADPLVTSALLFIHITTVVLMAAPYYNLVIVAGRAAVGKAPVTVDRYVERLIRGNAQRCFVLQATALATGFGLIWSQGLLDSWTDDWVFVTKLALLAVLFASLSYVHFGLQPRIDAALATVEGEEMPAEVATRIGPIRLRRKRMAAACFFVILTILIVTMQMRLDWPTAAFAGAELAALGIAWATYKRGAPWAWA